MLLRVQNGEISLETLSVILTKVRIQSQARQRPVILDPDLRQDDGGQISSIMSASVSSIACASCFERSGDHP